ncbi:hypothetical protein H2200_000874 [Cladophialophora chaetospira]|uniref:Right handed beta helix domain-containing protein n=1 Tax=Cladophialophora chaetospira TaxID=386627 RepID=A0AA39CRE4_9EURO|nr:hypothetical protein H2200_000874 [Cladophialophora chaetospira]
MARITSLVLLASLIVTTIAGGWNDWHGDATHVSAGESIQAAIDTAKAGQLIFVGPGTYAEQLTITTDGIHLVSKGAVLVPPASFVQNTCSGLAGNETEAGICIEGQDIQLAGFEVEHRKVLSVGTPIKDVLVTGFQVQDFTGLNIAVVGGLDVQIVGNTLHDGSQYGALTVGSTNTHIDANNVAATGDLLFIAVCMDDSTGVQVTNNDISNYAVGLCVQTNNAYVANNRVTSACFGAFVDPGVQGAQLLNNYIGPPNQVCANSPGGGIDGVLVFGASGTTVKGNTIEGQLAHDGSNGDGSGIAIVDDPSTASIANDNTVTGNILRDNDLDILIYTNGTGNVAEGNQCTTPAELCGQ